MDGIEELYSLSDGLSEEEEEEEEESIIQEDLLNKNTKSFRCLAQVNISRSSLLLDPFYWFPEIEDPNLEEALWRDEAAPVYDNIGREKYIDMCKQEGIKPYRRVLDSLETDTLDLSFYGLSTKDMKAVCATLAINEYVKELLLDENRLSLEGVQHLDQMLQKNETINKLNLRECRIGPAGAAGFREGFAFNRSLLEIELSFNELGDEGVLHLAHALHKNKYLRKVDLSHNKLSDRALDALGRMFEENYSIMELDLSWNHLDGPDSLKTFMESLQENMSLRTLNLSWCGVGDRDNMRPLFNYLRAETCKLEHLDLSNNRITGIAVKMLKTGLKANESLVTLNLSSNPMVPSEVDFLANVLLEARGSPFALNTIDFSNIVVKKSFIRIRNLCRRRGFTVKVERITGNFKINEPNMKHILLERAKFVALTQKKKKFQQDFGIFLICQSDEPTTRTDFVDLMKKKKVKLDTELLDAMLKIFVNARQEIDPKSMKECYLELYPDTKPPEKKKKKKKQKKPKVTPSGEGVLASETEPASSTAVTQTDGEQTTTEADMTTDTEGEIPQSEDEVPQSEDGVPQSDDGVPQSEDGVPQSEDEVPQSKDEIPQSENEVPQSKDEIPQSENEGETSPTENLQPEVTDVIESKDD